ncbi:MAG: YraN family protein [Bacteroidaceae bacterium]|nr:YraN family protein [Bacteroidaceae bacterium]
MALHNIVGEAGEKIAAGYLERHGYTILDRNWRCGHNEIDIIARNDRQLVIAEVKTRSGTSFGKPEDAVTDSKIRNIVRTADSYIKRHCIDLPVRFDIITVIDSDGESQIEHIEDAFFPPLWH